MRSYRAAVSSVEHLPDRCALSALQQSSSQDPERLLWSVDRPLPVAQNLEGKKPHKSSGTTTHWHDRQIHTRTHTHTHTHWVITWKAASVVLAAAPSSTSTMCFSTPNMAPSMRRTSPSDRHRATPTKCRVVRLGWKTTIVHRGKLSEMSHHSDP